MTTATLTYPAETTVLTAKQRISSIDLVRGIVMVIMALDHARDFYHIGAFVYNPTDMATTTPVLFFTRWITHFCAPAFVLLAGTSIYITGHRKSTSDLSVFLLTRGFWLIVVEIVVMRFSFFFNFYYDVTILQVIWVIGASMVCMAALVHIPSRAVLALGLLIIFTHNILDVLQVDPASSFYPVWAVLRQSGFFSVTEGSDILVFYPLIPWLGIMMAGYGLGQLYRTEVSPEARRRTLLRIGSAAVILFVILRLINAYGDPAPWSVQKDWLYTVMSFLNCTKYPVSLLYTLMTLGPVLIALALLERIKIKADNPFLIFGRVPLFYYILHFFIIHTTALLLFMHKTGTSFSELDFHFSNSFGGITPEGGYSLFWAYVGWIAVVVTLYPLCRWYNRYKASRKSWWLSYV